ANAGRNAIRCPRVRGGYRVDFIDQADEAITSPMCGFNETRSLWIVTKSIANLTNSDLENGFADKCSRPNRMEKIVFGDELTRPRNQMIEYCKSFRPQLDWLRPSPQLPVRQIEAKGIEQNAFFVPHIR